MASAKYLLLRIATWLTVLAVALLFTPSAAAQVPGYAEITRPVPGEALTGLVTIYGTADHPAFVGYDLAFAYADNPTDTWFSLGEPVHISVLDARLGLWDTTAIADGDYLLRLRVWLEDGTALEAIVRNLRVRNQFPAETVTPPPPVTEPPPTMEAPPISTSLPAPTPLPLSGQSRATGALAAGVLASMAGLGLLAFYGITRSTLRPRWAAFRTRYLHRRSQRGQRARRGMRR